MLKPKRGGGYLTRSSYKNKGSYNGGGEATESLTLDAFAKMIKPKRHGVYLTRSSHKKKQACSRGGEAIESLISGDLHRNSDDACTKLSDEGVSNLSKSVASLALSNGHKVLFSCSGIAIDCRVPVTRFLTSASLVRALKDAEKGQGGILKIEVRHEGCEVHAGFLAEHSLDQNFAVVKVMTCLDVNLVLLKPVVEILPNSKVVAVGRGISGKAITSRMILASDISRSEGREGVMLPNGISQDLEGGPLFDSDGNFVGMNLFVRTGLSFFLSWNIIIERLEHYFTSLSKKYFPEFLKSLKAVRVGGRPSSDLNTCQEDMILVNTFEDTFGDACGEGVWNRLSKKVSSNINRYVVALASFNGDTRVFVCTGFFIEWKGSPIILTSASLVRYSGNENKINENLKIEVLLSNNRRREGRLKHYDLQYNVALVCVEDCLAIRPADTQPEWYKCHQVLAVGRFFKSNTVVAAGGRLVDWSGTLDCQKLMYSSCKISKAGIGGPLIDLDGKVVGMNFYDKIGTPFLLWNQILCILACFEGKRDGDGSHGHFSGRLNRWPVPLPYLRHRDHLESKEDDTTYGYIKGIKFMYA